MRDEESPVAPSLLGSYPPSRLLANTLPGVGRNPAGIFARVLPFVCERNPSPIMGGILFSEDGKQNDTPLPPKQKPAHVKPRAGQWLPRKHSNAQLHR